MATEKVIETDVLVVGGGMAGNFAANKAREQGTDVTLVDKAYVGKSGSTHFAEGDYTFLNPERGHKLDAWLDQISRASEYLNNREWGEIVLKDSYARSQDLTAWGVKFYQPGGKTYVRRSGVHEHQCMVNREYAPALRKKSLASGVKVLDKIMICELLKQDGRIVGAIGFDTNSGDLIIFKAKATVLAAGGSSLKLSVMAIHYATADADAMAYRAGAEISGKEFMSGSRPSNRSDLKKTGKTYKFTGKENDVLARFPLFRAGIMGPMTFPTINAEGGRVTTPVWEAHCGRIPLYINLDAIGEAQDVPFFFQRLGTAECEKVGLDVLQGGILKVSPGRVNVAKNVMGGAGIWPVNTKCASALPGLFAAGDCCATMLSGAGYAGMGMGLCHATVTGARAGLGAAEYALKSKKPAVDEAELASIKKVVYAPLERKGGFSPSWVTQVLRSIVVPYYVLQIKHKDRLKAALTFVEFLNTHLVPRIKANDAHEWRMAQEAKNMGLSTEMILRASLYRTESRGSHFREDYPRRDDPAWLAWVKIKEKQGKMKVWKEPIPKAWWPDLSKSYEERYPGMFPGE